MLLLLLVARGVAQAQEPPASPASDDLQRGKRLFQNNCAVCHGFDGAGGTGPSLARAKLQRAPDIAALIEVIIEGIPAAGMPPSWHLLPNGPKLVAAYVLSLGQVQETPITGDVSHGRAVYRQAACGTCHIVRGEGVGLGPELTDIGSRRTAAVLRQTVLNPAETIPQGFVLIRAYPKKGRDVAGIRLNEDSFTIQIKDQSGRFHSYQKEDLLKLEKDRGRTWMPSYASLSGNEVDDLVAYLSSLRGTQ